jgi:uracil-DNA glycosylase
MGKINLESSWLKILNDEFEKPYMKNLSIFLNSEKKEKNKIIYPPGSKIFNALNLTPFTSVKVIILGQDPYHGQNQANGLSFSVEIGNKIPPSLQNIFKELNSDLNILPSQHGDLSNWAKQGVLLLNTILTVESSKPSSHSNKGWEIFTDKILHSLSSLKENLVFILWGKKAQEKILLIDESKHKILKSPHPSPYSANNGFFGSQPFSKTNFFLESKNIDKINWKL